MAPLIGIVALVCAGAVWVDGREVQQVLQDEARFLADGGDILVASVANGGLVDAAACESLAEVEGVRAAGVVSIFPLATGVVGRPEVLQTVATVSPGALGLFSERDAASPVETASAEVAPEGEAVGAARSEEGMDQAIRGGTLAADEVLVSRALANRWDWQTGSRLQLTGGSAGASTIPTETLKVAGVANLALLDEAATAAVLTLRPASGEGQRCFVRIQSQYRAELNAALPAQLGDTADRPVQVVERLPAGAGARDFGIAFNERPTRLIGLAAGGILGLLWAIVVWTRRGRAALYATVGVRQAEGMLIRWTEGAAVTAVGVLCGTALGVTAAIATTGLDPRIALDLGMRTGLLAASVLVAFVVLAGVVRPRTATALKDR